jgi:hypothetical protein
MWRYAGASVAGASHATLGTPCQDAHACALLPDKAGGSNLVAIVSDGAGSAARSAEGAACACAAFIAGAARRLGGACIGDLAEEDVRALIGEVRSALVDHAREAGAPLADFACTLLGALIGERAAVFCQIGDGAMIYANPDDPDAWSWVFWPQRGEYANATSFVTDADAVAAVEVALHRDRVEEAALFSDGVEKLVLHYETRSVHAPFFAAMFPPIRGSAGSGEAPDLSSALSAYLDTPAINRKTDDDKTLILATRRKRA